jgi:hypothetical protein
MHNTLESAIKFSKILQFSMLFSNLLFIAFSFILPKPQIELQGYINIGFVVGILSVIFYRKIPYKMIQKKIFKKDSTPMENLDTYKSYKLVQYAILDFGILANLTLYFLYRYDTNLYAGFVLMVLFGLTLPSEREFNNLFSNDEEELVEDEKNP